MSKTLTAIWNGYMISCDWIEAHPHGTFWLGGLASVGQLIAWLWLLVL